MMREGWLNRPMFFHGLMAGLGILAAKFCFYLFHHWEYNLSPTYVFLSWALIMVAMVLACLAERRISDKFGYWQAFVSCLVVAAIALMGAVVADQLLYRVIDPELAVQTRQTDLAMTMEAFQKNAMLSEAQEREILAAKSKIRPEDYYSFQYVISFLITKTIGNGLFGFIIAAFLRRKTSGSNPGVV